MERIALPGEVLLHDAGHGQEAARRHTGRRMGQPPVVVAADIHVEEVHARLHQILHVVQGLGHAAAVLELLQGGHLVHPVAVGLVEGQGQVDAVHDGVVGTNTAADLLHHVQTEALPVGVLAQLAAVEGPVGHLLQQIALVAVEVHAVNEAGLGVRRRLARVPDDAIDIRIGEAETGQLGDVEIPVEGGGHGELGLLHQAGGRTHTAPGRGSAG